MVDLLWELSLVSSLNGPNSRQARKPGVGRGGFAHPIAAGQEVKEFPGLFSGLLKHDLNHLGTQPKIGGADGFQQWLDGGNKTAVFRLK